MKRIVLSIVVLMIAAQAAAQSKGSADEWVNYWRKELAIDLPVGSSREAILDWVSKNNLKAKEKPKTHELTIRLDSISTPTSTAGVSASSADVCTKYQIVATLKLDANDHLASATVNKLGSCF